ncbi:MAG: cupin domain-containing protein [Synergistaceae bacterium]|nr:cupin domain-containing protein [Synergistaceae bacterium]MBR0256991.1 cupin domain-containing protein [Synergistaceae bacterium]
MLIDFTRQEERVIDSMNGGRGKTVAKMFANASGRVIVSRIEPGASIGLHVQNTGNDINFVASGKGRAVCDGVEEILMPGVCHYCPKGSSHMIENTGDEDLVLYTVVDGI